MSAADQNPFDWFPEDRQDLEDAAKASLGQYGLIRELLAKKIAERHGLTRPYPLDFLDKEVQALRNGKQPNDGKQGTAVAFDDPEPWPVPVDGAALFDEIATWLRSFVDMSKAAADACALWAAYTWCIEIATYAALLIITAPTKQSGKTRLLKLVGFLVRRLYGTSGPGATAAVIFRLTDKHRVTLMIDEVEKLRGGDDAKQIIGLLNDGYERGNFVPRCSGDDNEVRTFNGFGFRGLAAIGDLFETLMDRGIVIRLMRAPKSAGLRRAPGRVKKAEGAEFARRLARWTSDHLSEIETEEESAPRPEWLDDRACDKWAGLFAVAAVAGGEWPARAIEAAKALSSGEVAEDQSAGVTLLWLIRRFLVEKQADRIESAEIVRLAAQDDEAPTGRGGRDLDARDVARLLKPFGIKPRKMRFDGKPKPLQGYRLEDLQGALDHYPEPSPGPDGGSETEHPEQRLDHATSGRSEKQNTTLLVPDRKRAVSRCPATDVPNVPDREGGLGLRAGPKPIPDGPDPWTDDDRGEIGEEPEPEAGPAAPVVSLAEPSEKERACVEYVLANPDCTPYDAWDDLPIFRGRGRSEAESTFEGLRERGIFETSRSAPTPRYRVREGVTV